MKQKNEVTCTKRMAYGSGYHFRPCGRPAKFVVRTPKITQRCGVHASLKRYPDREEIKG